MVGGSKQKGAGERRVDDRGGPEEKKEEREMEKIRRRENKRVKGIKLGKVETTAENKKIRRKEKQERKGKGRREREEKYIM